MVNQVRINRFRMSPTAHLILIFGLLLIPVTPVARAQSVNHGDTLSLAPVVPGQSPTEPAADIAGEQPRQGPVELTGPLPQPQVALAPPDPLRPGTGDYAPDKSVTAFRDRFSPLIEVLVTAWARLSPVSEQTVSEAAQTHLDAAASARPLALGGAPEPDWRLDSQAASDTYRHQFHGFRFGDPGLQTPRLRHAALNLK